MKFSWWLLIWLVVPIFWSVTMGFMFSSWWIGGIVFVVVFILTFYLFAMVSVNNHYGKNLFGNINNTK